MINITLVLIICIVFLVTIALMTQYEFFENSKIPRIIIQTWKDDDPPQKYFKDIESFRKINPNFKYLFFTDEHIENFLQQYYPEYYETYKKLPIKIQKIDFFRYIAVYHYGGFYFDLDMICLEPLDDLLKYDAVFPIDLILTEKLCKEKYRNYDNYCRNGIRKFIGQYAFGAIPKHPFIKRLIDNIHNNIELIIERKNDDIVFVYKTTGPDYVTDNYYDYPNKENIHILEYPYEQYFGKYAMHNMYGTWK